MRAARRTNHAHTLESGLCLVLKSKAAALRVGRSPTRSIGSMALSITPYGLRTLESAENGNGGLVQKLGVHEASERRPLGLGLSIYERFDEGFPVGRQGDRRRRSQGDGRLPPAAPKSLGLARGGEERRRRLSTCCASGRCDRAETRKCQRCHARERGHPWRRASQLAIGRAGSRQGAGSLPGACPGDRAGMTGGTRRAFQGLLLGSCRES